MKCLRSEGDEVAISNISTPRKRCRACMASCSPLYEHCLRHKDKTKSFSSSAYRADRPAIRRAEASVFPSFFSQLKSWIFFNFNFPSLGLEKIIEKHNLSPIMKIKCFSKTERNFHFEKMLISLSFLDLLTLHFGWLQATFFFKKFFSPKQLVYFYISWNLADFQLMAESR